MDTRRGSASWFFAERRDQADLVGVNAGTPAGVRPTARSRIINGHAGVASEMDLSLHQALGTREDLWLDMQKQRDLWVAKQAKSPRINRLVLE